MKQHDCGYTQREKRIGREQLQCDEADICVVSHAGLVKFVCVSVARPKNVSVFFPVKGGWCGVWIYPRLRVILGEGSSRHSPPAVFFVVVVVLVEMSSHTLIRL